MQLWESVCWEGCGTCWRLAYPFQIPGKSRPLKDPGTRGEGRFPSRWVLRFKHRAEANILNDPGGGVSSNPQNTYFTSRKAAPSWGAVGLCGMGDAGVDGEPGGHQRLLPSPSCTAACPQAQGRPPPGAAAAPGATARAAASLRSRLSSSAAETFREDPFASLPQGHQAQALPCLPHHHPWICTWRGVRSAGTSRLCAEQPPSILDAMRSWLQGHRTLQPGEHPFCRPECAKRCS